MAKQNELAEPSLVDQSIEEVANFKQKLKFMFENGVLPSKYLDVKGKDDKVPTQISEKKLNEAMAVISYGKALGLTPEMSLTHCMNVNGHMSIYGDAINAIIYSSGLLKKKVEYFDESTGTAVCTIERKDIEGEETRTFSFEDAKIAGLWGKGVWKQYPKRMAQMRARGFAFRDVFPDLLHGMITTEEAMDMPVSSAGGYSDVIATAKVKKAPISLPEKSDNTLTVDEICGNLNNITSEQELKEYYRKIKGNISPAKQSDIVQLFADRKKELKEGVEQETTENTDIIENN